MLSDAHPFRPLYVELDLVAIRRAEELTAATAHVRRLMDACAKAAPEWRALQQAKLRDALDRYDRARRVTR